MNVFKSITRGSLAFLCTLSLWNNPVSVHADCCPEDEGFLSGWRTGGAGRTALVLGGAVLLGGIAGAIAGNATSGDRGHDGNRGPRGPSGVNPFNPHMDETLVFAFDFTVTASTPGNIIVIPFVTRPDGITVQGPIVEGSVLGFPSINPIIIDHPPFGSYYAGVLISSPLDIAPTGISARLANIVTATSDGTSTLISSAAPVMGGNANFPMQIEIINDFSYLVSIPECILIN